MKRILIAFLSVFFANVAFADNLLHINSNIVGEIVKKHIPPTKQFQALSEYNQIVKERGGITPDEIRRVCAAAGWQTDFAHAMTDGTKCDAFVEDLLKNASVKFYEVCGKDKSGGKCINDFQALTTNMIQATGLAKLYVYTKDKTDKVVCSNTPRLETTTVTSNVRGGMNAGIAPATTINTHYVQCKALDKNIFYEFKFNNTRGTSDSTNHRSFKTGICSVFGYKFQGATKKDNREKSGWDICDGATKNACGMINNALTKAHSGYFASWGPLGRTLSTGKHGKVNEAGAGYELSASQLPYCILTANAGIKYDGTAYERTAFGLDGRYFLSKDIQTQGTAELHEYIRKYVVSRGIQIQEFSCAETYVTVKLVGRSDSDDMITCTINGSTVDFFFDDLSESKSTYIKGAKQALDCMVSGGTFTGKKCIGLGKEQCEVVRAANAVSCPECKQIKWNSETNICELPASASASKLKRGLNYTAIVGGAVVGIVITVGTLGTSSAPTIAILGGVGIETAGSVIELIAQMRIDEKADKFFTQSANCKNQTCAEKLIKDYLRELANQSDSLLDSELTTADEEFARLFDLIPPDAEFYTKIVENGIRGETVESNKRGTFEKGSWNSDQIWRAVGIGLQIIPTVASVGWKIAKKSDKLVKSTAKLRTKLDDASKHVDELLKIKNASIKLPDFLQSVDNIRPISTKSQRSAVYEFRNTKTGRKYFLKYNSDTKEIERTRQAYEILKNSNVTSGVNIVETDMNVIRSFATSHGINIPNDRMAFIMESVLDQSDMITVNDFIYGAFEKALPQLGNKALTVKEQELILEDIKRLNNAGVKHGDLPQNMYIYRDSSGKIRVSIIDYESWATDGIGNKDIEDIERYFSNMQKRGLALSKTDDVIAKPLSYYVEGLDKISDDEDLLFNLKILSDNRGLDPYERRPVIKNILEKNGLKYGSSSDLNAWYIRQSTDANQDLGYYEIWSPIIKGREAKEVMPKLIRDFDNAGISTNLVVPIKAENFLGNFRTNSYQALTVEEKWRLVGLGLEDSELKLSGKFSGYPKTYSSLEEIQAKYPKDKYLFKGAISSDDYMAFSARPGRSGSVYATPDVEYAQIYDGLANKWSASSATGDFYRSNAFAGDIENGYIRVGFINVYEQSPNNVYYKNFGIESYRNNPGASIVEKTTQKAETLVTLEENPLVEKFLHIRVENFKDGGKVEDFYVPVKDQSNETVRSAIDKIINNQKADPMDTYDGSVYNRLKAQKQEIDSHQ